MPIQVHLIVHMLNYVDIDEETYYIETIPVRHFNFKGRTDWGFAGVDIECRGYEVSCADYQWATLGELLAAIQDPGREDQILVLVIPLHIHISCEINGAYGNG